MSYESNNNTPSDVSDAEYYKDQAKMRMSRIKKNNTRSEKFPQKTKNQDS